jgi:Fe2+ transport system protein FeoA
MVALTECNVGEAARVISIDTKKDRLVRRLSVFGVGKGAKVKLLQKEKTCVIGCNSLEFAVDAAIAAVIKVERIASA